MIPKTVPRWLRTVFIIAALLALSWAALRWFGGSSQAVMALRAWLEGIPPAVAALLFIVLYVFSSFIIVDIKDGFKIVGALLFGPWGSSLVIFIAELINMTLLFHLARRWGRKWLEKRFGLRGEDVGFVRMMCGPGQIFLLRSVPLIPYRMLDLAYGLTPVSFPRYFGFAALASPMRIIWIQFVVAALGTAILDPVRMRLFLEANPVFLVASFVYLLVSGITALLLYFWYRRKK